MVFQVIWLIRSAVIYMFSFCHFISYIFSNTSLLSQTGIVLRLLETSSVRSSYLLKTVSFPQQRSKVINCHVLITLNKFSPDTKTNNVSILTRPILMFLNTDSPYQCRFSEAGSLVYDTSPFTRTLLKSNHDRKSIFRA